MRRSAYLFAIYFFWAKRTIYAHPLKQLDTWRDKSRFFCDSHAFALQNRDYGFLFHRSHIAIEDFCEWNVIVELTESM